MLRRIFFLGFTLFFLLQSLSAFAGVPVASNVRLIGVMKRSHTLTVSYDYFDPDGHAESGSIIQWIRYDDNCGTNPVIITTGLSYNLAFADEGKHIAVRVTPRDSNGEVGVPVEYRPWSCAAASPA